MRLDRSRGCDVKALRTSVTTSPVGGLPHIREETTTERKIMSATHAIEQHPDLLALKASYERTSESVVAQGTFGLALLTAIYAAISPWVIGFNATAPRLTANDLIVGIAAAVLATGFGMALDRTHGLTWTLPVLGVWLIISPWVIAPTGPAPTDGVIASNVIAGGLVTLFGLVVTFFGFRGRQLAAR
jgi:hypothetical protein